MSVHRTVTLCLKYRIRHRTTNGSSDDTMMIHQLLAILKLTFLQSTPNKWYFSSPPSPPPVHCCTGGSPLSSIGSAGASPPSHGSAPSSPFFTLAANVWTYLWKPEQFTAKIPHNKYTVTHLPASIFIFLAHTVDFIFLTEHFLTRKRC